MEKKYFLGIDGGASNTIAVIFDSSGKTISSLIKQGTNLSIYKENAVKRIIFLIEDICRKSKLDLNEIKGFGIALAGISDLNYRDLLLIY